MPDQEPTKEERILRMVKRVLTDVAKDTYTRPGYRHPLSDGTVNGIRDCLALISARETELAEEAGRPMKMRPRFVDEPRNSVVVPLNVPGKKDRNKDRNG
ncbi:MAG: segregation and condensation protein A [Gammaproteobacteria bacterium]|nr:MAG: segregation and condensation protein A [Gammaproteobacteria bacterium]